MAINKKADSKQSKISEKAAKAQQRATAKPQQKTEVNTDAKKRDELISKSFHPTVVEFLKKELGIDLNTLSLSTIYDMKAGRMTEPLSVKVTPLAYDRSTKEMREMLPIQSTASMRFVFPYDNDYNPVALDKDNRVFVGSYPCHDYIQKADPSEVFAAKDDMPQEEKEQQELPKFSQEQIMALEGIGINPNRLYSHAYNALDIDTKRSILKGEAFDVDGYVRTSFGQLYVCGQGKLITDAKGNVKSKFLSNEPKAQGNNRVLDILSVRRKGDLELDFFERDANGRVKTDVYDFPILNKAGKDLVTYGVSFVPIDGYIHKMEYNSKEKRFEDKTTREKYQVSVINGGLCATKMRKVVELDKNGKPVMTSYNGKEVEKYHYEVTDVRLNADDTIKIGKDNLKFKTPADLENYKRGKGGLVEGASWKEYTDGKKEKVVKYDAFVVPDNQRNGFAKQFSPSTTAKLTEGNAVKKSVQKKQKQNFSMGF